MVSDASFHTLSHITDSFPNDVVYALFYVRVNDPSALLYSKSAIPELESKTDSLFSLDPSASTLNELRRLVTADNLQFRSEYDTRVAAERDRLNLVFDHRAPYRIGRWVNYAHDDLKDYKDPESESAD
jgi:hypothetical protein